MPPIPAPDPIPLPAPYWVFKLLLIVTFTLHLVAMNFLVGGALLALAGRWSGRPERANRLFRDVAGKLPVLLPATVTLGVAPLLFLQVIYGPFFYTSSVILAWPWFLALVMLTVAYYGLYYVSARTRREAGLRRWTLLASFVLIAAVGFLFCNNLTLSQTPSAWAGKYFAGRSGWNLNLGEPTLAPRYLHFFAAAVALGGLFLMLMAWLQRHSDEDYRRYLFRFGGRAFEYATMAQFAIGVWFLLALPGTQQAWLLGGSGLRALLLGVGVAGTVAAIVATARGLRRDAYRGGTLAAGGCTVVVVLAMVLLRDMLRDNYLGAYFHPERFQVQTQWTVLPLFLALFLGGVALWLVMLRRYPFTAAAPAPEARPGEK